MKKFLLGLGVFLVATGVFWWLRNNQVFLNPLSSKKNLTKQEKIVKTFGFLPTWMVGKTRLYGEELDNLIFLGIEVDSKGNLIWDGQAKKINSEEFLKQKITIKSTGGKNILGFKLFRDEDLDKLLGNKMARENLVQQIKQIVKENDFDGVNIDFEYQNDPVAILSDGFVDFLDELQSVGEVSVDVFVNTLIKGDEEKIKALMSKLDYLIIMAYDFHRPGVDFVGPVAPIGSNVGERNIREVVQRMLSLGLESKKIILAYPLYGYEWKTYTDEFGSQIRRGWYALASWKRMKTLIEEKNLVVNWDETSMTPWVVFKENGVFHQIYFENEKSLGAKKDLIKQNKFGGVGFWALGYEGEDNVLLVDD